jgi:hypothetical protein
MREMTCTTLYDQPCLPSIHGNATYSGLRNRIKHLDVLRLLDEKTVFIVNDWAMKFLPQRYRESQQDWFGKRGISWHIYLLYTDVILANYRGSVSYTSSNHVAKTVQQWIP